MIRLPSSLYRLLLVCSALGLLLCAQGARALATSTTLISRALGGGPAQTDAGTRQAAVSDDGRFVAFLSNSTSYGGNPEGRWQVFLRDQQTGQVSLVSRSSNGSPANRDCFRLAMSRDGRFVAFASDAVNLEGALFYPATAVYLRDVQLGKTELVSQSNLAAPPSGKSGVDGLAISADGRFVAFTSDASNLVADDANAAMDVFVRDRETALTERVSQGRFLAEANSRSGYDGVGISDDGRFVTFSSYASNLVAGDNNNQSDVFVRDRLQCTTERASIADDGSEGLGASGSPSISADGSRVAFISSAPDLVPGDNNLVQDAFVRERLQRRTQRVSVNSDGSERGEWSAIATISPDGGVVAFWRGVAPGPLREGFDRHNAYADVFTHELATGVTELVSTGADGSSSELATAFPTPPSLSSGGRFVAWVSLAGNLAAGDTNLRDDAFLRDRLNHRTDWISVGPEGSPALAGASSTQAAITPDGRFVAFTSDATNLVPGDTNGVPDVFVWDRQSGAIERVSVASEGTQGDARSGDMGGAAAGPEISADGRYVAFASAATNLVSNDRNLWNDTFVRDRLLGITERVSVGNDGRELLYGSQGARPALSADGRFVAFASYGNGPADGPLVRTQILIRDRVEGTTERVSRGPGGAWTDGDSFDPAMSGDGRFVAFSSLASNLVTGDYNGALDIFVYDRQAGTTERVNLNSNGEVANDDCYQTRISADGRYVLFLSSASNLVAQDWNDSTDAFVRDRSGAITVSASSSLSSYLGSAGVQRAALSPDGRFVAFTSVESSLPDVFLRDLDRNFTDRVGVSTDGVVGNWRSPEGLYIAPAVSRGGRYIAFSSDASNLVAGDTNGGRDLFLRDRSDEALPSPSHLTASLVSGDHISLRWTDESSNEDYFHIERREGDGPFHFVSSAPRNSQQFEHYGASPPGPYTYRVRAVNWAVTSGYSNEAIVTYPEFPAPPYGLTVTPKWPISMGLAWSSGSENTTGFVVERSFNATGPYTPVRGVSAPAYTDVSVTGSTTYYYRVAATNPRGRSEYSEVVSATTLPYLPSVPFNLRVTQVGQDWIALGWDDFGTVEEGYRIERRLQGGTFAAVGEAGVNQSTFIDRNLPPSTRFEYRVISFNRSGEEASGVVEGTTLPISGGKLRFPRHIDFGKVPDQTSRTRKARFQNQSTTESLHVNLDTPGAPFSIEAAERSFVIPPRSFHTVAVTCRGADRVRTTIRWKGQSGDPKGRFFEIRLSAESKRAVNRK